MSTTGSIAAKIEVATPTALCSDELKWDPWAYDAPSQSSRLPVYGAGASQWDTIPAGAPVQTEIPERYRSMAPAEVARRIEETSQHRLSLNYGTLYPALLKLEQEGFVRTEWGQSENNRRAKFYSLTAAGRKQLAREAREWHQTADLIAAFLAPRRKA